MGRHIRTSEIINIHFDLDTVLKKDKWFFSFEDLLTGIEYTGSIIEEPLSGEFEFDWDIHVLPENWDDLEDFLSTKLIEEL